jgi:ribosome-associated toxin RatA of RatAB toxin-antitoxin module
MMFRATRNLAATTGGRSSARRLIATLALMAFSTVPLPAQAVPRDDPPVTVTEDNGLYSVAATFTVPQASSFALAALTDYPQIPRFMPEVRTSKVLERTDDRAFVEQEAVARFMMFSKRVHLVLEVQEDRGTIRFSDRCGKSFSRYEGVWTITERDAGTHVTYELSAKPSFDVPEFLLKRLLKRDASQMIERLKAEIGARAKRRLN